MRKSGPINAVALMILKLHESGKSDYFQEIHSSHLLAPLLGLWQGRKFIPAVSQLKSFWSRCF